MKIYNTTLETLQEALKRTNEIFNGNVIWNRSPESLNEKDTAFVLTLRVKNSSDYGARRSTIGRKMVSACYHVHGMFFDYLFELSDTVRVRTGQQHLESKYDNWNDFNIGSEYQPCMMSYACECSENGLYHYFKGTY